MSAPGTETDYLVSFGVGGAVAPFRAPAQSRFARGQRVVVSHDRGEEIGSVLCPVREQDGSELAGRIVRVPTAGDERLAAALRDEGEALFAHARGLAERLALPFEVLDVEGCWGPRSFFLHCLAWQPVDERPLVSELAKEFDARVRLIWLNAPPAAAACGTCGAGGCGDCGAGGCSTGGCGSGCGADLGLKTPEDWQQYFAGLRRQMDRRFSLPTATG
jgi:cell fate regulator YaaT (PSP1 superfamily)